MQAQIEADKAERKRKADLERAARAGAAPPPEPVASKPTLVTAAASPSKAYTEARLRLQTPAATLQKNFGAETTLFEVAEAVGGETGIEVSSFTTNFPKRTYDREDFGMTLKEAGMVPSAALIVK